MNPQAVLEAPQVSAEPLLPDPKRLYRKIEDIFQKLPPGVSASALAQSFAEMCCREFLEALHLSEVQVYEREPTGKLELKCRYGAGETRQFTDAGRFSDLPQVIHEEGAMCAILPFGEAARLLLAFFVRTDFTGALTETQAAAFSSVFFSLSYALVQSLKLRELRDDFEQAREIQVSLIPEKVPHVRGFDIAVISIPAKQVAGDIYDFQRPAGRKNLQPAGNDEDRGGLILFMADAAGHGLPAALQARDVTMGWRMGMLLNPDLTSILENLNIVIRRSGLASRLVSMFAAHLHPDGRFEYVNAGHPRPILHSRSGFHQLMEAGMILGTQQAGSYRLAETSLLPGDSLVIFTDGVTEHAAPDGTEFGTASLMSWLQSTRQHPAEEAVADLVRRLRNFGNGAPFQDDVTVLLIKRYTDWI